MYFLTKNICCNLNCFNFVYNHLNTFLQAQFDPQLLIDPKTTIAIKGSKSKIV